VTIAEIENKAKVEIATAAATIMAEVGRNARFVNFGGGSAKALAGEGNVLFDTLMGVPALIEKLDIVNQSVNPDGEAFQASVKKLVNALAEPIGAAFHPAQPGEGKEDGPAGSLPEPPEG